MLFPPSRINHYQVLKVSNAIALPHLPLQISKEELEDLSDDGKCTSMNEGGELFLKSFYHHCTDTGQY